MMIFLTAAICQKDGLIILKIEELKGQVRLRKKYKIYWVTLMYFCLVHQLLMIGNGVARQNLIISEF